MRKLKNSNYTFLIICEGENTEPSFFKSIRDYIIDGTYQVGSFNRDEIEITIRPEPKDDSKGGYASDKISPHKPKRNNKKLKKGNGSREKISPHPLNFIEEGKEELKDGTFNEVWAVFDHDNHPALKEAFENTEILIDNKKVNIAFSSISFEYYLLLHFERVYKKFAKSECREGRDKNKKIIGCGTGKHTKDCQGALCVGGYARSKGYWINSKDKSSIFPFIKDKIEIGFLNSAWLRNQNIEENEKNKIYERNPYVTTDFLIKRLTGYENYSYEWTKNCVVDHVYISIDDNKISTKNLGTRLIIIPENSFTCIEADLKNPVCFGSRVEIAPQDSVIIELPKKVINGSSFVVFTYQEYKKIFCIKE